ncbi:MAG: HAMP domain-containing sensor histidine kinase [Candidatus Gracilibacteria bacterium]|nr:HAMP domain-containing sensor histidine kinase [Candidatus Gracilibacteria bacterium]
MYIESLYITTATLVGLTSFLALKQNHSKRANLYYTGFGLFTLFWMCSLYFGFGSAHTGNIEEANTLFRAVFAFGSLFMFFLTLFFYEFPNRSYQFHRFFEYIFIGLTFSLATVAFFTKWIYESVILLESGELVDIFGFLYPAFLGYTFLNFAIQIYLFIQKRKRSQGIEKQKISLAFTGMFLFNFAVIMTNVILPLFNFYIFQVEAVTFSLIFLIPALYSMRRFRFFGASYTALKITRTLILITLFSATTAISFLLLSDLSIGSTDQILIVSALAGLMLYTKADQWVPELTTTEFRQFRTGLETLRSQIFYCQNYSRLLQNLENVFVLSLHLSAVKLYLVREKEASIFIPIYIKDDLVQYLESKKLSLLTRTPKNNHFFTSKESQLCLPIYLDNKVIGLFFIGKKADNEPYSQEEINEIKKTHQALQVCFINILLQSNLNEENNLMKDLIQKKTKSLRSQNMEIKQLLRQQSDFIAVTAHEFRTPLNIALLQLEDTLDSYDHNNQVLADMDVLGGSLERLKSLTQNLFDVQKYDLEKVTLKKEPQSLQSLLQIITNDFQDLSKQKQLKLHLVSLKKDITINCDAPKIHQVFSNIISNAMKFTPEKGKIEIEAITNATEVQIHIRDTGTGISEDNKKRVFEKFQSTDATQGMGIGMGLYICKKIIELHMGSIHVVDNRPKGSVFILKLPIHANASTQPKPLGEY